MSTDACGTAQPDLVSLLLDPDLSPLAALVSRWLLDHTGEMPLPPPMTALVYYTALAPQAKCTTLSELLTVEEQRILKISPAALPEPGPHQITAARATGKLCAAVLRDQSPLDGDTSLPLMEALANSRENTDEINHLLGAGAGVPPFLAYYDQIQREDPFRDCHLQQKENEIQLRLLHHLHHIQSKEHDN